MAAVLVAALRDATSYNSNLIDSTEVGDVSDVEEFLGHLGCLEGEIRMQYEREQKLDPKMLPYEEVWRSD